MAELWYAAAVNPFEDYEARVRGHQLTDLRWHWGEAYDITWSSGLFRATRRDDGSAVSAASFVEMHQLIRDDYSARPVPRDAGADEETA